MRGMKHPPAFDGLATPTGGRPDHTSAKHPPRANAGTDLASQIAERLGSLASVATARLTGDTLMSRLAGMEPVPATVRVRPEAQVAFEPAPTTAPPAPSPHFAARRELPEVAADLPHALPESDSEPEPTTGGTANDNYPRLLQAVRKRRRQRWMSALRNIGSWFVTVGAATAIIGVAAFFMVGAEIRFEPPEPATSIETVTVTSEPVVPAAPPQLVTAPKHIERAAAAPPLVAPAPRVATQPRAPAKLVKPIEPAVPRKKTAAKTGSVKASSPSPGPSPAVRAAGQRAPGE